ncbi:MAG: hypothetical protein IIB32_07240 [Chloroflexi bacterium]|nr:hypothetical protein [Chloroflexota bacterium]
MSAEEDIRRTIANSYDLNDWAPMESVLARREALGSREDVPKDCGRPSTVGAGFQVGVVSITIELPGYRRKLKSREDVPKDCGRPSTVGAGFQPALQLITCPLPGFLDPGNA